MAAFQPGFVHTPVTPFTRDHRIDFDRFARLIGFHIANGADALALPMHAGESVSLSEEEKRALIAFAVKQCGTAVPVIAHVSNAGSAIAADLARRAQDAGAAAIIATTPYYWTPPPAMLLEHFAMIGAATRLPFYVHNAPDDMAGAKVSADLMLKLIGRLETFAGVVDSGLDWQFMIELVSEAPRARPAFQLVSGMEHMVSAGAIGARGTFSSLVAVAPKLVRRLYESCREQKFTAARATQEAVAALHQLVKPGGIASLKAALRVMGRDCGEPRPPLLAPDAGAFERLAKELDAMPALREEPRGW